MFEKRIQTDEKGNTYRADKHTMSIAALLDMLHWKTLQDIFKCLTNDDLLEIFNGTTTRNTNVVYYANQTLSALKKRAKMMREDWIHKHMTDSLLSFEGLPETDKEPSIEDMLSQMTLPVLGKILGDLDAQDVEWFNDNISNYKQLVHEAGKAAVLKEAKRILKSEDPEKSAWEYFISCFGIFYGGRMARSPEWIRAEQVVGINRERLAEIYRKEGKNITRDFRDEIS